MDLILTPEQQEQFNLQQAIIIAQRDSQLLVQSKQAKLEAVRLAKEVLIENSRNRPVNSREVLASDVTEFANTLVTYIES